MRAVLCDAALEAGSTPHGARVGGRPRALVDALDELRPLEVAARELLAAYLDGRPYAAEQEALFRAAAEMVERSPNPEPSPQEAPTKAARRPRRPVP